MLAHYCDGSTRFQETTKKGGSRTLPPRKVLNLLQEQAVPLRSHFREDTRGACIVDGESHSVLHHRKGPGGGGKTDLGCKIRRIRGIRRSGTEVVNLAGGCPGNVEGRTGELGPWSKEKRVVDCALFGQVEARRPVAHGQRIIRYRDNPEQAGLGNVPVEIVNLRSRTGIEQVNSYEHERSAMVGTILRNVFTLEDTHVGGYVVAVAVAVRGRAPQITQRGKSPKIGDAVQFHIEALKPERNRSWGEDVDHWREVYASRNGHRVGIPRGYLGYSGRGIECGRRRRGAKVLSEQFPYVQLGLCVGGCSGQNKYRAKTSQQGCNARCGPAPGKMRR